MEKKKYVAYGYTELSIIVPFGSARVRVDFTGGQQSAANGLTPASFSTTNPVLQRAIENSRRFKDGFIEVFDVVQIDDEPSESDESQNAHIYTDVTNVQSAKAVLMETYNVSLAELQNKEAIKAKAEELNVEFPNWK